MNTHVRAREADASAIPVSGPRETIDEMMSETENAERYMSILEHLVVGRTPRSAFTEVTFSPEEFRNLTFLIRQLSDNISDMVLFTERLNDLSAGEGFRS